MNILVLASALSGGGIIIYEQFINHLKEHIDNNKYVILVNKNMSQPDIKGVMYLCRPIESKINRILFERYSLKKELYKNYSFIPDVLFSLQNTGCKAFKDCRQIVYYHQSLPIYDRKWNLFKKEERIMFLYKHIFPIIVKRTFVPNTDIITQIPFIKRGVERIYNISPEKVHVCFPDIESINISEVKKYDFEEGLHHFIYVAGYCNYKNHSTLVSAISNIRKYNPELCDRIRVHFTLKEDAVPELAQLIKTNNVEEQFVFEGLHPHDEILQMYKSSRALLFPSSIETLGLPLLEAAAFGIPIIAADISYAHEVLGDYEGVIFRNPDDIASWARDIEQLSVSKSQYNSLEQKSNSSWHRVFELINSGI